MFVEDGLVFHLNKLYKYVPEKNELFTSALAFVKSNEWPIQSKWEHNVILEYFTLKW